MGFAGQARVVSSSFLGPGDELGRFRIERALGSGGMGRVYGVTDELLNRRVAVKVLHSGDPSTLVDEARALASLHHPNVVLVLELAQSAHGPLVVMEWIDGRSADTLVAEGPAAPPSVASIITATAKALAALHEAGWVHGDVKPSNILIERRTGRVVLADMGLAQRLETVPARTFVRGTPGYMAPEAALGGPVPFAMRGRRDVYALAVSAYELLTGALPFDGPDPMEVMRSHVYEPIPRADVRLPALGWRVHRALARALTKKPSERTASPIAFAEELARAVRRPRSPLRLLVVDDDRSDRDMYSSALARAFRGAQIEAVSDGETGFHAAAATSPDLAIIDVAMPHMNGVELVATLRATPGLESLPVIVVSGNMVRRDRELLGKLGVARVLEKPIALRELTDVTRAVLELPPDTTPAPRRMEEKAAPPPQPSAWEPRHKIGDAPTLPDTAAADAHRTVMIVEDDDELREGMAVLLERRGTCVVPARDGAEALALIDPEAPPALILLDLMMPVMDGWRLRQVLHGDPRLAAIPVVLISALPELDLVCKRLDATDYFTKPIDFARLHGVVERYCAASV
jgi:CheY-like chemotaxis protein